MDITQLFANAQETLLHEGKLRLPELYIEYLDPETHQDCLEMCVFDMPETVQEQISFVFGAGRQFGQKHRQAPLQRLTFVAEIWENNQDDAIGSGRFVQPADDPQRREAVLVEEANFVTPERAQIRTLKAAILRDSAGAATGLAEPQSPPRQSVVNSALHTFVRGVESASLTDAELARLVIEQMRKGGRHER